MTLYVPLITPFDTTGEVALGTLEALAHKVLGEGADGLVALGTTAEPGSLSEIEQLAVVDIAARVCREHDARLVVGANSPQALEALRGMPGIHAALTVVPPYIRPGEAGVLAWFSHLTAISPVPLIVYNVPYRTGQPLSESTLRELAAMPGVVGVKHAVGGIDDQTVALMADPPADFVVLGGDDAFVSPLLALGAHGAIMASAHVATARYARMIAAWRAGDLALAQSLGRPLATLSRKLFAEPNPAVIKAVLHTQGLIPTASVRLPMLPAGPEATQAAIRAAQ